MPKTLYNSTFAKRSSWCSNLKINDSLHKKVLGALKPRKKDTILEIGCNKGDLVKKVRPFCKKIIGIDNNKEAIASSNCSGTYYMDATKLTFPDESFDKIVSLHTIEHIPDLKKAFKEMERVLKPGGMAVLSYPFELFWGMTALGTAIFLHKNIFMARKIHAHKLDKKKVKMFTNNTKLDVREHNVVFCLLPVFVTTLIKT